MANVSQEEDCRQIVDKAVDHFGGVDVLILNAAYSPTPTWFADLESPVRLSHMLLFFKLNVHTDEELPVPIFIPLP